MSDRYVAIPPKAAYWDDAVGGYVYAPTSVQVFESDKSPVCVGLLDANGVPLYRIPETVKLGFHRS
jgi:hypothetical protein